MSDTRRRAEELFFRLLDTPHGEREALLSALDPDPEVRREALELLAIDEGTVVATLGVRVRETVVADVAPGAVIGPYTLVRQIGEGGFGVVWLARQSVPVEREVALKILKPGVDTRRVVARFESERQLQARLDHPSVSRVLDAGVTPEGRPFFTMDYVAGIPITTWCDEHRVPIARRVALFCEVCDAVQFAHQKGIVHRDLKPGNLLVQDDATGPRVRVLDFGIAKALRAPATDGALTVEGQVLGTPDYMSPEQLAGEDDVDTRTDVFALGVLLYELLTGALPWGAPGRGPSRAAEEPLYPSRTARRERSGEDTDARAACRATDARALARTLSGDLDWITLCALAPERERRYGTAAELAADLRRYLADEPVVAGPPSRAYRARKFVRRHRAGVVASAIAIVALVAGAALALVGLRDAQRAERRATAEAHAAEAVTSYLVDLFGVADPDRSPDRNVTAKEILAAGAAHAGDRLAGEPLTEARMRLAIGRAFMHLGLEEQALPLFERTLALRHAALPEGDPAITEVLMDLADCQHQRGHALEALDLARRALAQVEAQPGASALQHADALNMVAIALVDAHRVKEAIPLHERALALRVAESGEGRIEVVESLSNLGAAHYFLGEDGEAAAIYERAAGIIDRYGLQKDTQLPYVLNNLGAVYARQGKRHEAETTLTRALAAERALLGPEHFLVAATLQHLGDLAESAGDLGRAAARQREALALREKTLAPGHPAIASSLLRLGRIEVRSGHRTAARPLLERALAIFAASETGSDAAAETRRLLEQTGP